MSLAEADRAAPLLAQPVRRLAGFVVDVGLFVVTLAVGWIVWSVFEARVSRTPGMRITGQRIVDVRTGEVVDGRRMARRQLLGIPLALLLGAVTCGVRWLFSGWLVVSPSRQALWDRVAGTTVVEVL